MKNNKSLTDIFKEWSEQDERLWSHKILDYIEDTVYHYKEGWQEQFLLDFGFKDIAEFSRKYEEFVSSLTKTN